MPRVADDAWHAQARTQACAWLARRELSREELIAKLQAWQPAAPTPAALVQLVEELAAAGLQSDTRCADYEVRRTLRQRKGAALCAQRLRQRQLAQATIDSAMAQVDWRALARDLYRHLLAARAGGDAAMTAREHQKIAAKMVRMGHSTECVSALTGIAGDV